ncbi:MAG: hypothetical protein M3O26_15620 [Pseudomonadota bacterium]|nr:hypothetical protein [Pseudomonadota bacterium]
MRASDLSPEMQMRIFGKVEKPKPRIGLRKTAEDTFAHQCRAMKLPPPVREHKFALADQRLWRFDFAWPDYLAALECEGLVIRQVYGETIVGGRHVTPTGFRSDALKYAYAAIKGWHVLRFEQSQVHNGTAIDHAILLLTAKGWNPNG